MIRIAIQGIAGSYSQEAAIRLFGEDAEIVECADFAEAFDAIGTTAEAAVVPVRNSIVGEIGAVARLISERPVKIAGETSLEIRHVLAGTVNSTLNDIAVVRSHIEALKQCRGFLDSRPDLIREAYSDTASSIRTVMGEGRPHTAAICSPRAAELYAARVLAIGIADKAENHTVFQVITKQ